LIPYIQSLTCQQVPPPYHFPGVTANAFILETSIPHIQRYCDRYFNIGEAAERGFEYKPIASWPYAALMVIDYPVMICADDRPLGPNGQSYADGGYVKQQEVFVTIPIIRRGINPATAIFKTAVDWMLPFIVVGNAVSASCGREMLGLEKLLAEIKIGDGGYPDAFSANLSLPGWASLRPTEWQQMLPFLDIVTGPAAPTFKGSPAVDSLWTLFSGGPGGQLMAAAGAASNFVDAMSLGLIPTTQHTISLKQIRDAEDPQRAVYQSIVSCRSKYTCMENFRFYNENDVTITIHDHGSFSEVFRAMFDPPDAPDPYDPRDRPLKYKPKAAFRFNSTIDFDEMRTLHEFPVDRGHGLPPTKARDDTMSPWMRPLRGFFGPRQS